MSKEELLIYNTVKNNLPSEFETQEVYIAGIQAKMAKVDAMTADVMYAFIRKYQMEETPGSPNAEKVRQLPYGSKVLKKGLKVDLAVLPQELLCMLYIFLTKYYSTDSD